MPAPKKKLAAIMFTDIVGYTRLMGQDETKALSLLRKNREIHKGTIREYGGKWLKEIGDGNLASFDSISDAVACAGALINASANVEGMELRIGVHQGEIVLEGDEIYGDGVNIASRIENQAEAGTVYVSDVVNRNIRNKGFETNLVDEMELKNVEDPVKVYRVTKFPRGRAEEEKSSPAKKYALITVLLIVTVSVIAYLSFTDRNTSKSTAPSQEVTSTSDRIAILPFDDRTSNQEFNSLGKMISDWTTQLVYETGQQIVSPKTVEQNVQYAGILPSDPSGRVSFNDMTGATKIVEGEYYLVDGRLRISARLIDAIGGEIIYQFQEFEGSPDNIAKLVEEASQVIAGYLAAERSVNLGLFSPPKYEAYKVYQQALETADEEEFIAGLKKAMQLDSSFSSVYRYSFQLFDGDVEKAYKTLKRHKPQLTRYEELNMQFFRSSSEYERHRLLKEIYLMDPYDPDNRDGYIGGLLVRNMPEAALALLKEKNMDFTELDVSNFYEGSELRNTLSAYYQMGDFDMVLRSIYQVPFSKRELEIHEFAVRILIRLERPLDEVDLLLDSVKRYGIKKLTEAEEAELYQYAGAELLLIGKKEFAADFFDKVFLLKDQYTRGSLAYTYLLAGNYVQAETVYDEILADSAFLAESSNDFFDATSFYRGRRGLAKALLGKNEEALNVIDKLLDKDINDLQGMAETVNYSSANCYTSAQIYAQLGQFDRSMELLSIAYEKGGVTFNQFQGNSLKFQWDPFLLPLRDYEPFIEFCQPKGINVEIN